ncbi:MAG: 4-alpha-glucanotransferase [Eubacterium sp.]
MTLKRSSGILMHISSLPGDYGIGSFGKEAKQFADFLHQTGCSYWQTLPFGPVDVCNSPYKSFSAFAGNPYFIDLETLSDNGLLTPAELLANKHPDHYTAAFDWLEKTRLKTLHLAFTRIDEPLKEKIKIFTKEQAYWLPDYALYMTLKEIFDDQDWYRWPDDKLKNHDSTALQDAQIKYADQILFQEFLQYTFFTQWQSVKKYANTLGVEIIGDMPIYVSLESSDVWAHPEVFDLDSDGHPLHVAGVPPDYFSVDGQLWGNPLYHWKTLKANGYQWWIKRIDHSLKIYDAVRIDHFRAFSAYWSVDANAQNARNGKWIPGPGMDFFNTVFAALGSKSSRIIAEDLGVMDDGVIDLLKETGLPGMRVLQFAFIEEGDNIHLPHNYVKNCVAYTGTHDNNTLLGWQWELLPEQRHYALSYVNYHGKDESWQEGGFHSQSCRAFIRCLWQSSANVVITPIQDLCGYGSDTKMNYPGVALGNWAFRLSSTALSHIDIQWLKTLNDLYKR